MSTPNFSYENRCIIIPDENLEFGDAPKYDTQTNYGTRDYPSYKIDRGEYNGLTAPKYHAIVLTPGYYCNACIDFVETEYSIADEFSWSYEPETVREVIEDLSDESGLSRYRIAKLADRLNGRDIFDYWEAACKAVDEYMRAKDRELCNAICDHIKKVYGLDEYERIGIFNNGEAIYSKIA